jgi:mRNA-degrading endonuclease RelE of RelBE toxin-antitoxin system
MLALNFIGREVRLCGHVGLCRVREPCCLKANLRAKVKDGLKTHLRHEPTKTSRSRIKRLRGLSRPQYRIRIEDVRVFYDVTGSKVEVVAIIEKSEVDKWLAKLKGPK